MGIADGNVVIHNTSAKIGSGRLVDGVYHFSQVQACHISISSFDLLHRHSGHPSSSAMNKFKNVSFDSNSALTTCTVICKLSKLMLAIL